MKPASLYLGGAIVKEAGTDGRGYSKSITWNPNQVPGWGSPSQQGPPPNGHLQNKHHKPLFKVILSRYLLRHYIDMELITADETGLIKLIELKGKSVVSKWGHQKRSVGVNSLAWCDFSLPSSTSRNASLTVVASVTASGSVEVWDPLTAALLHTCTNAGKDALLLASIGSTFVSVCRNGDVRVFPHMARDADAEATCKVRSFL